jgi:putative acetyltransferase
MSLVTLRPYDPVRDEDAALALWLRTWQKTYPDIDFAERFEWWSKQWRDDLVPKANIVVAEALEKIVGFVTVELDSHYLDQLVVAPEFWGIGVATKLIAQAKQLSPDGLNLSVNTDNARAIAFYEKEGFVVLGNGINEFSGRPVHHMIWRPLPHPSPFPQLDRS